MVDRQPDREEFVNQDTLNEAAEAFVARIGWRNADYLRANLRLTLRQSDALRALDRALTGDFNVVRQEQIRREQMEARA
jgi:hypothetical protein